MRRFATLLLVMTACGAPREEAPAVVERPTEADARYVLRLLDQADRTLAEAEADDELLSRSSSAPLTPDEKQRLMQLFAPLVDEVVVLDGVRGQFRAAARTNDRGAYALVYAAHAAELSVTLSIVGRVTGRDVLETVLNEPQPEWGLAGGQLDRMQRFALDTNSVDALENALPRLKELVPALEGEAGAESDPFLELARRGLALGRDVKRFIERKGLKLEVRDTVQSFEDALSAATLPAVTSVATWMGDTKYAREKRTGLITTAQVDALVAQLRPGDIILERRNWYVSNIGLPGFWPHAAFFVGTQADLEATFDSDPEVLAAYGGPFTAALQQKFPKAWLAFQTLADDGQPTRIAEAVSEGVIFNSAHHSLGADYVGALRPRLRLVDKARAVERAFARHGLPYDFEFDFTTDDALVCSELVYKSYQQRADEGASLVFPLASVLGRPTLPPSDIVHQFDRTAGTPDGQLDFVGFLDGSEASKSAVVATETAFRDSWRRPKWDFAQE